MTLYALVSADQNESAWDVSCLRRIPACSGDICSNTSACSSFDEPKIWRRTKLCISGQNFAFTTASHFVYCCLLLRLDSRASFWAGFGASAPAPPAPALPTRTRQSSPSSMPSISTSDSSSSRPAIAARRDWSASAPLTAPLRVFECQTTISFLRQHVYVTNRMKNTCTMNPRPCVLWMVFLETTVPIICFYENSYMMYNTCKNPLTPCNGLRTNEK